MTDKLTEARYVPITSQEQAPAVFREGWLPDTDAFPELAEAREKLAALNQARADARARQTLVVEKMENDAQRRELEMRDAYLRGERPPLEAEDPDLKAELLQAQEQGHAATSAYLEQINRCVALVVERREAWFATIDLYQAEIDAEVQRLMEEAAKLRTKRGNFTRFELWCERTGGRVRPATQERPGTTQCGADYPADHFPYADMPLPVSGDAVEEEARMTEFFMRSFAGFDGKNLPLSEEQGRALDERNAAARAQDPEVDLQMAELGEDDLVDWLMGCGQFDGKPKPGPELTVAVVEDDPAFAARMLRAERTATGDNPRQAVVSGLNQISGGR